MNVFYLVAGSAIKLYLVASVPLRTVLLKCRSYYYINHVESKYISKEAIVTTEAGLLFGRYG